MMANKYLEKIAFLDIDPDTKKELKQTAVMGTMGGLGTHLTDMAARNMGLVERSTSKVPGRAAKLFALGGAIGTGLDYGAVKINRAIEHAKQPK